MVPQVAGPQASRPRKAQAGSPHLNPGLRVRPSRQSGRCQDGVHAAQREARRLPDERPDSVGWQPGQVGQIVVVPVSSSNPWARAVELVAGLRRLGRRQQPLGACGGDLLASMQVQYRPPRRRPAVAEAPVRRRRAVRTPRCRSGGCGSSCGGATSAGRRPREPDTVSDLAAAAVDSRDRFAS